MMPLQIAADVVITLAGIVYIAKNVINAAQRLMLGRARRAVDALEVLHGRTYDELIVSFDFWWNENFAQGVTHTLVQQNPMIERMGDQLPEELVSQLVNPVVTEYAKKALHVAVHARTEHDEMEIINRLPRLFGARAAVLKHRADMLERVDQERSDLEMVGVDLKQLESFAMS